MANTLHGLPYPIGTDRVMDGDDAIKALAQAMDDRLVIAGLQPATTTNLAQYANTADNTVTFPIPFPAGSNVTVVCSISNGRLSVGITAVTLATFTFNVTNLHTAVANGTWNVFWMAMRR